MGRLDFNDWLKGLAAAFISGGATAVVTSPILIALDPKDFNFQARKFYVAAMTIFVVSGLMNGMNFLRVKPLPGVFVQNNDEVK